jgi:hypothetical protein
VIAGTIALSKRSAPAFEMILAATNRGFGSWALNVIVIQSEDMLGLILPALIIGPATTAFLWSHHPMLALAAAPLGASAAVFGLAAWIVARQKAPARRFHGRTRARARFGSEWHAVAHA